jgi:hypothetical protein
MKKIIYGIAFLALVFSCQEKAITTDNTQEAPEQIDSISDPNVFIGKHKAKAMVLGVFHFKDAGLDDYKPKFHFDILESKRQAELDVLLKKIAAYKPTKILLEWNRIKMDSTTNAWYQEYLAGTRDLSEKSNEVFQIGFKLAKKMGHQRVYCSDASADWFGVNLDWDNFDGEAYLKSLGQLEKSMRYDFDAFYELGDSLKTTWTLAEHLAMLNEPENRLKSHQAYLTEGALAGAGDNYLGADAVANWYRRNIRIFANAYDLTNFDEEERILLIYGSGHAWQLRQFFTDSPDFDYVEPNEYLKH